MRAGGEAGPSLFAYLVSLIRGSGFVQHPPELPLVVRGQRRRARRLRLEERAQEYAIIQLGAYGAEIAAVELVADTLRLKDLCLAFAAAPASGYTRNNAPSGGTGKIYRAPAYTDRGLPKTKEPYPTRSSP